MAGLVSSGWVESVSWAGLTEFGSCVEFVSRVAGETESSSGDTGSTGRAGLTTGIAGNWVESVSWAGDTGGS